MKALFSKDDIPSDWRALLGNYFESADWLSLEKNLQAVLNSDPDAVRPEPQNFFKALKLTPVNSVKAVILGQDPYPTPGVAVGRAFAVSPGTKPIPASLRNIFRELQSDVGGSPPTPDLAGWQSQGVFLLNRHLTTIAGAPGEHFDQGWQQFIDAVIEHRLSQRQPLLLVLWGAQAASVIKTLHEALAEAGSNVFTIQSPHPSPLSAHRGFFGSKPFSTVNHQLQLQGQQPIDWNR